MKAAFVVVLVFAIVLALCSGRTANAATVTPVPGNCVQPAGAVKDESAPFSITVGASQQINGVRVKAGDECFNVDALPTGTSTINACYSVTLTADRKTVTVVQIGAGPECKGISHIIALVGASPTPSPTPSVTPSPTAPAPTTSATTTPTPTASPTASPTVPPSPSPTVTASPTPTPTQPPGGGGGGSTDENLGTSGSSSPPSKGSSSLNPVATPVPLAPPLVFVTVSPPSPVPPIQSVAGLAPAAPPAAPQTGNAGLLPADRATPVLVFLVVMTIGGVLLARRITQ